MQQSVCVCVCVCACVCVCVRFWTVPLPLWVFVYVAGSMLAWGQRLTELRGFIGKIRVSVVVGSMWVEGEGYLTGEFTYWPSGDVPQLRCGCWKTNPCSKSWHYISTQLKLSCEGQAEIVTRVWLRSDKVLAIQQQTNIQTNIVLSLWQLCTAPWQCPNIAISICTPWIITQNAGILGRLKLFYYF